MLGRTLRPHVAVCAAIAVVSLWVTLRQLLAIHDLCTPVGFVDAWPLYDRLMKYSIGQLTLVHYLLDPHVHPHSIVYFLYLLDEKFAGGRQLIPHAMTLLTALGLIALIVYLAKKAIPELLLPRISSYSFVFGTFILLTGISEATVIPFQCVVVVTRFTYVSLLALLLFCQVRPNKTLHAGAIAASVIAVSFYASGGVFAMEVILLHLLFFRRWKWLLASIVPLLAYLWLITHFVPPRAEADAVKEVIRGISLFGLERIVLGIACYYASVLITGWPFTVNLSIGTAELPLYAGGIFVAIVTLSWSIKVLWSRLLKSFRGESAFDTKDAVSCLMALLSCWVFVSSVAAALLWMARAKIFAVPISVHWEILTATRYAAFSSLAFIVLFFILMTSRNRNVANAASIALLLCLSGLGFNSLRVKKSYPKKPLSYPDFIEKRTQLDIAATALLMGMSPADHECDTAWPGVGTEGDWYWPGELPKVVAYIRSSGIDYAHGMPSLGDRSTSPAAAIVGYQTEPVPEAREICRLSGRLGTESGVGSTPSFQNGFWAPRRIFPIRQMNGKVVGYALNAGSNGAVVGHVFCKDSIEQQPLYLSAIE